ncbi:MAG: ribosome maturation factor RimM [Caldiserica bacterium]|nr:ribosome maturation factor RimM [Caldisericota bacterium]
MSRFGDSFKYVCVGKILKAHGVSGWVKVKPFTSPERFQEIERVFLNGEPKKIEAVKFQGPFLLLKLAGIENRSQAEAFSGSSLRIPSSERPPLPEGEFYVEDLKGLKVLSDSGETIGEIFEVWPLSGNDVFLIRDSSGNTVMVPALKEAVIEVNLQEGYILVKDWGIVR